MIAPRTAGLAAVALACSLGGLSLGWYLWGAPAPVVETPASEVRQRDSSLVLERRPDPGARARHEIPRGTVLERVASLVVRPDSGIAIVPRETDERPTRASGAPVRVDTIRCECQPVTVDLSLVREANGARRVIASARGGTVVGGLDVPVETAAPPRVMPWALGASYDVGSSRWGVSIDRDVERLPVPFLRVPLRLGASVTPRGGFTKDGREVTTGALRVALRF